MVSSSLLVLLAVLSAAEPDTAPIIPGAIVVDFKDGTTQAQIDEWEKRWSVDLTLNSQEGVRSGISIAGGIDPAEVAAKLEAIRQNPAVESAEPLGQVRAFYQPNDPDYAKQWNLEMIHMPKAWDRAKGKGVVVAVLDTGIAYEDRDDFRQVPDLKGVTFVRGYDFVNDDEHANDDHGHGTHVAGTIAQATNNGVGVAGVAFEASLMPVKVLNHFGTGNTADIADAIRWAADHGAKVLNLSLGGGLRSEVMASAVKYARAKGAVVICAAGNTGLGRVEYPAAYDDAVAVGAVGPKGVRAPYSSYGKALDIAAPGGDKREGESGGVLQNTIDPRDPSKSIYAYYQGTSMATPHVAGVAALLFARGAKSPDEVERALYAGARAVDGKQGWSEQYGNGLLNAEGALAALGGSAGATSWAPVMWGAALLAGVLLTLRRRQRPGYLNVLFAPGFLIPFALATAGVFFIRWLTGSASDVVQAFSFPLPDWERIIFGRKTANPLVYSALIPAIASIAAIKLKAWRPVVAGLAIGFAGILGYAAFARAPGLAYLPFHFLAIPWLVLNGLVCLVIARAMLRREAAP